MALFLQITLAVVLALLCGFLIPLLLQLRRTAAAVQGLAESARQDLNLISADVHHLRERADALADLASEGMELPATLNHILGSIANTLANYLGGRPSPLVDLLLAGVKMAISLFRPGQGKAAPESEGSE